MQSLRILLPVAVIAALLAVSCSKKEETVAAKSDESSVSAKPGWLTSYDQAQKEAQLENKLLLLDFTGSDWCGWCIMLDREVFSKPEFKEYAKKNLVLLELDFPKNKKMPAEIVQQNQRLAMQYQIMAFPTVVVLDGSGKIVGALGYLKGGPSAFIAQLERIRNGRNG